MAAPYGRHRPRTSGRVSDPGDNHPRSLFSATDKLITTFIIITAPHEGACDEQATKAHARHSLF
ncbi:hypothetical protein JXA12_01655 [Candidatus Woesearchaeota archaeon]|nr:hypothetical protein [Candidatus Woesearchaeota archaeon]